MPLGEWRDRIDVQSSGGQRLQPSVHTHQVALMRTSNGGRAAVGTELDYHSTTAAERAAILEREAQLRAWRKTLPKRKRPAHEKPGPITWIKVQA